MLIDFWHFQRQLTKRLLAWSGLSILSGLLLQLVPSPFWRAFGQQNAAWGAIDAGIALFGQSRADRQSAQPDADHPAVQAREGARLRFLLFVNTALDIFYMLGGLWLLKGRGRGSGAKPARWRGHGLGVIVQGAFLFFFDLVHGLLLQTLEARAAEENSHVGPA